tara:strand:+ start:526 stop:729 length:204 start_codon:yes stop_codon:yes gene_type:complete
MSESPPPTKSTSMADMVVRYDLAAMQEEIKRDFTPDSGTHRLLNQTDISKRFKRRRVAKAKPKPEAT